LPEQSAQQPSFAGHHPALSEKFGRLRLLKSSVSPQKRLDGLLEEFEIENLPWKRPQAKVEANRLDRKAPSHCSPKI
jgi:hypothetical protein